MKGIGRRVGAVLLAGALLAGVARADERERVSVPAGADAQTMLEALRNTLMRPEGLHVVPASAVFEIRFDYNSAAIRPDAAATLDTLAAALNARDPVVGDASFAVEGHTDAIGPDDYNLILSGRRAAAVVGYLVAQGVAPARLHPHGYGEGQLLPDLPAEHPNQRRVELIPSAN